MEPPERICQMIESHIAMLIDDDVLERIGASKKPDSRNLDLRVMRICDALNTAEQRIAKLREALKKYGNHRPMCEKSVYSANCDCTCGFDKALKETDNGST